MQQYRSSSDPDGDQVWYTWVADDIPCYRRVGPYFNEETCEQEIIFPEMGIWKLRVKAIDIYGGESDLSDPLAISMPRSRPTLFLQFLQNFLENHPILYQLLLRFLRL